MEDGEKKAVSRLTAKHVPTKRYTGKVRSYFLVSINKKRSSAGIKSRWAAAVSRAGVFSECGREEEEPADEALRRKKSRTLDSGLN